MVELAIVLVILALIIAGVMAGRSLIDTAKLQAIISEVESYKTAVDNFETQYNALPGDFKKATSFWTTAQNGGTAVANGNGDGKIGNGDDKTEPYYAWNHLTLSKYVPGTFNGSSAANSTVGVNIPESRYISGIGYGLNYFANPWSYADAIGRGFSANFLFIGKGGLVSFPANNCFSPPDAYYIDSKIDDGTPDYGKVMAAATGGICTTGSSPNIVYDLTQTAIGCFMAVNFDTK